MCKPLVMKRLAALMQFVFRSPKDAWQRFRHRDEGTIDESERRQKSRPALVRFKLWCTHEGSYPCCGRSSFVEMCPVVGRDPNPTRRNALG